MLVVFMLAVGQGISRIKQPVNKGAERAIWTKQVGIGVDTCFHASAPGYWRHASNFVSDLQAVKCIGTSSIHKKEQQAGTRTMLKHAVD